MIYITEKEFSRQIELLRYLSSIDEYSICAWLYPESKATSVASFGLDTSYLEAVTSYEDNIRPKHTKLITCNNQSLGKFSTYRNDLIKYCDSLALYKPNSSLWSAVTVGHEGMCLIRDDSILNDLIEQGFPASTKAPSWW